MTEPVPPSHELSVTAAPEDVDELGHVSNLVYVRWVLEAAKSHSAAVGWGHEAYQRLGAWFVVQRHEIDYRRPAMGGDEIRLVTWIESWTAASSLRRTSIRRVSDDVELAVALTTWALVTADGGRPTRIPAGMKADFQ